MPFYISYQNTPATPSTKGFDLQWCWRGKSLIINDLRSRKNSFNHIGINPADFENLLGFCVFVPGNFAATLSGSFRHFGKSLVAVRDSFRVFGNVAEAVRNDFRAFGNIAVALQEGFRRFGNRKTPVWRKFSDSVTPSCRICNAASVNISIFNARKIKKFGLKILIFRIAELQIRQNGRDGDFSTPHCATLVRGYENFALRATIGKVSNTYG